MGSVIFEAVLGRYAYDNSSPMCISLPEEWLVNFRVPAAGNDGGLIAVVNSQEAAQSLADVLNFAARQLQESRAASTSSNP